MAAFGADFNMENDVTYPTLQPPGAGSIHPALARHHWLHRRTHAAVAVPLPAIEAWFQSPRNKCFSPEEVSGRPGAL